MVKISRIFYHQAKHDRPGIIDGISSGGKFMQKIVSL